MVLRRPDPHSLIGWLNTAHLFMTVILVYTVENGGEQMSLEKDFFAGFRPAFGRLEAAGFRKAGEEAYEYREPFLDGQFEAQLTVSADGTVRGQVIDLDTGEEYLPIRARHQVGGFVGTVREAYLEVLGRVRDACFVQVDFGERQAWIIPSNPKIYDIDAGFAAGGGYIEWHQHNNIKAGDEVYIYSAAPNSAILYRCGVEAADLVYHGMFVESKGYERAMRIRLIEKYPKDRFPLSFMKANGGSAVRSARRMPQQLLEAMRRR